ncbi:homoserine kinase [Bacillus sp. S/N-304-OC-R1]|uniref:homoserine kinase n=1 Tax=Bacillus sp. S/N-304-OC-R1 TaxID=2758034 RepID=UPI001C8EEF9A|nr:homoserine kinase [Bacillus sp. S/N-304-OC-R1]MBY0124261.1 homoserine kinase [Bacillus sp. S/N-304-OC-R1]
MSEGEMLIIKVPGSSANLGPGFDSIGLALNVYLTLEVEKSDSWEIIPLSDHLSIFPKDETNYIYQIAMKTAEEYNQSLPGCKIHVKSDIPLARGLGSSAAAIVAGIELADSLCCLGLSKQEKLEIASKIEGHPDNVGASLLGGLVVGCQQNDEVSAEVFNHLSLDVIAVVPKEELLTKESRGVLPSTLSYSEAVQAGAVGNVLIAALLSNNFELAGKMMKSDLYHHPYRKGLVPHMAVIEDSAKSIGAFGVALSGAGPTVLCLAEEGKGAAVAEGLSQLLPQMDCRCLKIDQIGSQVICNSRNGLVYK